MSQKHLMTDFKDEMEGMTGVLDRLRSRINGIEDRLMDLERRFNNIEREKGDTVDLSTVPVDIDE